MDVPSQQSLGLEAKVGQLFVAGFHGTAVSADLGALVRERNLGGVVLFDRNVESPTQVRELTTELQSIAAESGDGEPLLVATDQEGGVVSRFAWGTEPPGAMVHGAADDPELTRSVGEAVGRELAAIGVNLDFAPVLDVNNNPENPVIGVRSYGEEPARVARLGTAFGKGLQSEGVLACGKHFPGHGDTVSDSHHGLPVVPHDPDRLGRIEFRPFQHATGSGIGAVMTTHVAFPAITGDDSLPATLSSDVVDGLLRDRLEFDGLVVTDCLEMDAIADGVGVEEGAVRAIAAGCDLVLVSHTYERQRAAIDAVVAAVERGRIPESRIDEAVRRVRAAKRRVSRSGDVPPWSEAADGSREVNRRVARRGVTLVRDDGALPFDRDRPVRVVAFEGGPGTVAEDDRYDPRVLFDAITDEGLEVSATTVPRSVEHEPSIDRGAQVLVVTVDAATNEDQAETVRRLDEDGGLDVTVLAVRNPYDLGAFPSVGTYLTSYDYAPASLRAAAAVVAGSLDPTGRLPVTIPGIDERPR